MTSDRITPLQAGRCRASGYPRNSRPAGLPAGSESSVLFCGVPVRLRQADFPEAGFKAPDIFLEAEEQRFGVLRAQDRRGCPGRLLPRVGKRGIDAKLGAR